MVAVALDDGQFAFEFAQPLVDQVAAGRFGGASGQLLPKRRLRSLRRLIRKKKIGDPRNCCRLSS